MSNPQEQAATNIADLLRSFQEVENRFHLDQKEQWRLQRRKDKLNSLCAGLHTCDGELSNQLRNYLYDIELLQPSVNRDNKAILDIVARTTSGPLWREVQRYLSSQPEDRDQVPWVRLKAHIERTFLSSDEDEKLRVNLEQLYQREGETLASYNRRYREATQRAYPSPRSADAERIVLRSYLKGLRAADLAKKVSLELRDQTLEAALEFVERVEAGLERFVGLQRAEEPMDTSAVQATAAPESDVLATLQKIQKGQERVMTRLSKLETSQKSSGPEGPDRYWPSQPRQPQRSVQPPRGFRNGERKVTCFHCGGDHYKVGCPLLPRPQRTPRPTTRDRPASDGPPAGQGN